MLHCLLPQHKALSTPGRLSLAMFAVLLLALPFGAAGAEPASLPELQDIRVGHTAKRTRFVFDTQVPASYTLSRLEQPQRIIVDIGAVDNGLVLPTAPVQGSPIVTISSEPGEGGGTRIVFELSRDAQARAFALRPNDTRMHRIVIDIENAEVASSAGATPAAVAAQASVSPRPRDDTRDSGGGPRSANGIDVESAEVVADQDVDEEFMEEDFEEDAGGISSADDLFGMDEEEDEGEMSSADDLFGVEEEAGDSETASALDRIEGFVQFEAAYTYASPTHWSKARTILELGTDGRISDSVSYKVSGRAYYDLVFEVDSFYSDRVEDNREYDADVYETYIDISAGDLEFRLGRQHIIWGEVVGLFFADVVSAKDTRQFVNQDFDLIRIPQWAARAEYYSGDYHAELIWIPVMTYNEIGVPGDDFYPLGTKSPEDIKLVIKNPDEPSNDLDNSAYGLRVSALKAGWDISGFYYRSVDAEPAYFNEIIVDPEPTLLFTPRHKKIHQFGATLAKDFSGFLVKTEAVFTKDRYFAADVPVDRGVVQQDFLDYIVGLEHTTPDNTLLNFQVYQRWFSDHDSRILFDEFETGVSFFGKVEVNDKLDAELLLISQLNRTDWMIRPRVTWTFSSNWFLQVGADIMGGNDQGVFARFDDSDRLYTNVRYTF